MARDTKNYYQESPGQIRQKIQKFKKIPTQWNAYLKAKKIAESNNEEMDIDQLATETQ